MTHAAVVFDLDGTLLDTERLAITAGHRALASLGHHADDALLHSLIGVDQIAGAAQLQAALGEVDMAALSRAWQAESQTLMASGIAAKPGALDLVQHLQRHSVPIGIATSSGRRNALAKLAHSPLAGQFDMLVTRDCVRRAKPDPEPYLLAADRLGVAATACLAFEDSAPGAASARAAGLTVVLVPDLGDTSRAHPHHVAPDLWEGARMAGLIR